MIYLVMFVILIFTLHFLAINTMFNLAWYQGAMPLGGAVILHGEIYKISISFSVFVLWKPIHSIVAQPLHIIDFLSSFFPLRLTNPEGNLSLTLIFWFEYLYDSYTCMIWLLSFYISQYIKIILLILFWVCPLISSSM